jgi:hypothetical protein
MAQDFNPNGNDIAFVNSTTGVNLNTIATDGFDTVKRTTETRQALMDAIKTAAASGEKTISMMVNVNGTGETIGVDISTGAGALILDDYLQELSTVEQAAAQLVAAENKAQKQIHSVTGQG